MINILRRIFPEKKPNEDIRTVNMILFRYTKNNVGYGCAVPDNCVDVYSELIDRIDENQDLLFDEFKIKLIMKYEDVNEAIAIDIKNYGYNNPIIFRPLETILFS